MKVSGTGHKRLTRPIDFGFARVREGAFADELIVELQDPRSPWIWQRLMVVRQGEDLAIARRGRAGCYDWLRAYIPLRGTGPARLRARILDSRVADYCTAYGYDPDGYHLRAAVQAIDKARRILIRRARAKGVL